MDRKNIELKADDISEQGIFTGHASVFDIVDSDNDIIERGAFADTISTGEASDGVMIFAQHDDTKAPIGRTRLLREDEIGLYVEGYISDTHEGRDYRTLVKDRVLTRMSIGYIPIEYYYDESGVRHLTRIKLIEISIVNYPANNNAIIESYKGGNSMGEKQISEKSAAAAEATAATETNEGNGSVTLTEERLREIVSDAAKEGAAAAIRAMQPDSEPKKEENEGNEACKSASAGAAHVERKYSDIYVNTGATPHKEKSQLPPGIGFVRYHKCMLNGHNDPDHAAYIARKSYQDSFLEKEIKAANATMPSDGGYLVPETYAEEIIPLLTAKSILLKLGATVVPMENGNFNIPRMASGTAASYVGEQRRVAASKPKFENVRLSSKKLMAKVIISNDLIRSTSMAADQIILRDATNAIALAYDRAGLLGSGSEFEPRGIFNMSDVPVINFNAAPDESTIGAMLAKLISNNADTSNLGFGFNGDAWKAFYNVVGTASGLYLYRDQMDVGKLGTAAFEISNQIPTSTSSNSPTNIVLGNWSEMMFGRQGQMQADMSTDGTVTDENGNTVSAFDQDLTILRLIDLNDFAVRHPESFVIGKNIKTA